MKFMLGMGHVYLSFYGRLRIKIFFKVCVRGNEPFNLLILGLLPSRGFFVPVFVPN
jgi:hypothetical protein